MTDVVQCKRKCLDVAQCRLINILMRKADHSSSSSRRIMRFHFFKIRRLMCCLESNLYVSTYCQDWGRVHYGPQCSPITVRPNLHRSLVTFTIWLLLPQSISWFLQIWECDIFKQLLFSLDNFQHYTISVQRTDTKSENKRTRTDKKRHNFPFSIASTRNHFIYLFVNSYYKNIVYFKSLSLIQQVWFYQL